MLLQGLVVRRDCPRSLIYKYSFKQRSASCFEIIGMVLAIKINIGRIPFWKLILM